MGTTAGYKGDIQAQPHLPQPKPKTDWKKRFLFEFKPHALMTKGSCREPLGEVLMGVPMEILSDLPL